MEVRTGRPVSGQPFTQHTDQFVVDDDEMDSDTVTEPNVIRRILAQGDCSIAKDVGQSSKDARHRQTFLNMVNVFFYNIGSICIHGTELFSKFHIPSKKQGKISLLNRCLKFLKS